MTEKSDNSIATRAVGKRCGFDDMMPSCEDVDGEGRDGAFVAGACIDVDVGCGINVLMTVCMIAVRMSVFAIHEKNGKLNNLLSVMVPMAFDDGVAISPRLVNVVVLAKASTVFSTTIVTKVV